jgi:kynurenine 3-monooxygenase
MVKKIAIIGAGPSGLTLAHYLLSRQQNYQIDLYERRSDPRAVPLKQSRTFPISLGERGMNVLRQIPGLETEIQAISVKTIGSFVHQNNGKKTKINRKQSYVAVDRSYLTITILNNLVAKYDQSKFKIYFDCQCTGIDLDNKIIQGFQNTSSGESREFSNNYDILIGADGARSVVRETLAQQTDFQFQQNYVVNAYKSLYLSNPKKLTGIELDQDRVHVWRRKDGISIILLHQVDKTMNGVILFPYENDTVAQLKTAEQVREFFQTSFPVISQIMPDSEIEEFVHRPISRVLTVKCDRYHFQDSVLLIGDAAHAVSPSIGQGCNSALEDVLVLNKILDEFGDNWQKTLTEYSLRRVPDGHAVKVLSDYSIPTANKLFAEFLVRNTLGKYLHPIFPQIFSQPIFDVVFANDLSYSQILDKNQNWISKVQKYQDSVQV